MRSLFRLELSKSALIIIDMQKNFCHKKGNMCVPAHGKVIDNVKKLLKVYRANNRPVIFTRHIDSDDKDNLMLRWWDGKMTIDDPMTEILEELEPKPEEVVIKPQYNAFLFTDFEKRLRSKNIKQIVISGVLTNCCCESTARDAFMRGFEVYFINDATATFSKEMHAASLLNLAYAFAIIMDTDDVVNLSKR